jgi:serine/threonine protein kinase
MGRRLPVSFILLFLSIYLLPGFCSAGNEQFVFSGFHAGNGNLTLDGATTVSSQRVLELTKNGVNAKGHAFYPTPFQFKKSPNGTAQSFSATFVLAITTSYPGPDAISTDGMAFLISPTTNLSDASAAQHMGFLDSAAMNHTFAVEFDTVQNIELKDINQNHVGLDIGSMYSVPADRAGFYDDKDGTFNGLNLDSGKGMQVWVEYDGKAKKTSVTLAPMGLDKPSKPLLTRIIDLSTVLPDEAYVGFSAGTGPINSGHFVLAWSFAMNGPAPPIDYKKMGKLPSGSNNTLSKVLKIALSTAVLVLVLVGGIAAIFFIRRRKYAEVREDWEVEFGPHRFSYRDLFKATEGFKSKNILGVGGFGKVYKGVLRKSKSDVAVKRVSHDSNQGMREFISEVVSIGHLRHRNLVQLHGYCRRKGELLLVYDYMANGSLDKYLYGEENRLVLDWDHRFQIIKDVASGLFYLHEKWDKVVIHRDIKASNVLLDGGMNAHLGDFGLARLHDHGTDYLQTTRVVGTMGYIAPELARSGKASPLTDVFAFGTFLLEVTCGRRPVCNTVHHGQKMLVDRVLEYWHKGALLETVDTRMQGRYNADEARLVLTLGLMCSHPFPSARPTMRQVMQYLDGDAPLPNLTPANLSLLSMMQSEGLSFDQSTQHQQYPWSGISMATMTPDITEGR